MAPFFGMCTIHCQACFDAASRYLNHKISQDDHRRHPVYTYSLSANDSQSHGYWILVFFLLPKSPRRDFARYPSLRGDFHLRPFGGDMNRY